MNRCVSAQCHRHGDRDYTSCESAKTAKLVSRLTGARALEQAQSAAKENIFTDAAVLYCGNMRICFSILFLSHRPAVCACACVHVCVFVRDENNQQNTWPRVFSVVISNDETLRVSVDLEWDSV